MSKDKILIDAIIKDFFNAFTNTKNKKPDVKVLFHLCLDEVLIVRKQDKAHTVYPLHSFVSARQKILTDGTLNEFEEYETFEETKVRNNIAQRSSEYEKCGIMEGQHFKQKGSKFFQLIKTNNEWKITAFVWEDQDMP